MKISILMITYNAPFYVNRSIKTLSKTKEVDYELIVVDNNSKKITKKVLSKLYDKGYIDKLKFNDYNALFAKGNNIASSMVSEDSDYILLLNSDIKIKDPLWLKKLMDIHPKEGGVSALGAVMSDPIRADGYCFLINKELYMKYKLDEDFAWWWSVTKLQSEVLKEEKEIVAVKDHEELLHHYGGKSGKGYKDAKGMGISIDEVVKWFEDKKVNIKENINEN